MSSTLDASRKSAIASSQRFNAPLAFPKLFNANGSGVSPSKSTARCKSSTALAHSEYCKRSVPRLDQAEELFGANVMASDHAASASSYVGARMARLNISMSALISSSCDSTACAGRDGEKMPPKGTLNAAMSAENMAARRGVRTIRRVGTSAARGNPARAPMALHFIAAT